MQTHETKALEDQFLKDSHQYIQKELARLRAQESQLAEIVAANAVRSQNNKLGDLQEDQYYAPPQSAPANREKDIRIRMSMVNSGASSGISFARQLDMDTLRSSAE